MLNPLLQLIADYMNDNMISQAELARLAGISEATLSRFFKQNRNGNINTYLRILDALDLEIDLISKGE